MVTLSTLWHNFDSLKHIHTQLPDEYASLLIQVFWGKTDRNAIPELQQQLRTLFPQAHIMGTTTAGSIYQGQSVEDAVVISLTAFQNITLKTCFYPKDSGFNNDLKALFSQQKTPALLLAFADQAMHGIHFANTINQMAAKTPLAGGIAGTTDPTQATCVFDDQHIASESLVVTAFYGNLYLHQQFNFNWHPIGKPFTITRAQDNIVYEIENQPALDFYADYLGHDIVEHFMPQIALEFPLVFRKKRLLIARSCLDMTEQGGLIFAGDIPTGQTVQFGMGSRKQVIQDSIHDTLSLINHPIESIFIYSCIARKILLDKQIDLELQPLAELAPANGFFTHGEIAHADNKNAVLNQTLTYIALSESPNTKPKVLTDIKDLSLPNSLNEAMFQAMANLSVRLTKELEVSNQKYLTMAEHDQLTGLYNRYAGERILETEIARAQRFQTPLSIALIDIDFFKKVNDQYGHLAGDQVLVTLAKLLSTHVRKYDAVIRWGGEEVLTLLPNASADKAFSVIEKLRQQFAQTSFDFQQPVTFSAGIAQWQEEMDEHALFKLADHALYQAKNQGRNQTVIAPLK